MKSSGKLAIIWKNPDSFETIWKIGNHLEKSYRFESIGTVKKVFLLYAQKLSGRAKTFRVAMPPCYPGFCASGWWGPVRMEYNVGCTSLSQVRLCSFHSKMVFFRSTDKETSEAALLRHVSTHAHIVHR